MTCKQANMLDFPMVLKFPLAVLLADSLKLQVCNPTVSRLHSEKDPHRLGPLCLWHAITPRAFSRLTHPKSIASGRRR